jgi:hypothetical protein
VELVIWTFVAGLLGLPAAGFTLAVSQALKESYVGAALLAAMLALALWIGVILWPLRQAAQIVESCSGSEGHPTIRITIHGANICRGPVLRRGLRRGNPGPIGPGLCNMLHPNFRESLFYEVG